MIVVPDAGPLIYLAGAGHLDLLRQLSARVVVPKVVFDEVVVAGAGLTGATEVAAATWLEVEQAPPDVALLEVLDRGEAAAIPLAQRLGAALLCDDVAGRAEASNARKRAQAGRRPSCEPAAWVNAARKHEPNADSWTLFLKRHA